jgi:hypothetical protein
LEGMRKNQNQEIFFGHADLFWNANYKTL